MRTLLESISSKATNQRLNPRVILSSSTAINCQYLLRLRQSFGAPPSIVLEVWLALSQAGHHSKSRKYLKAASFLSAKVPNFIAFSGRWRLCSSVLFWHLSSHTKEGYTGDYVDGKWCPLPTDELPQHTTSGKTSQRKQVNRVILIIRPLTC